MIKQEKQLSHRNNMRTTTDNTLILFQLTKMHQNEITCIIFIQ